MLVRRSLQLAQTQAATDAAIIDTISRLSDEQVARHGSIAGSPRLWNFEGIPVTIVVTSEAGRIDINTADSDLIIAFLRSQSVSEDDSATLLQDLHRRQHVGDAPLGPEFALASNAPVGTSSASETPLESTEDLQQIPSWARQNLGCWNDALTVYTGLRDISSSNASVSVVGALQWAQKYRLGDREWLQTASALVPGNGSRSVLGEVIRIEARATRSTDVVAVSTWVGRLTGRLDKPMLTMHWGHTSEHEAACQPSIAAQTFDSRS
jgi:hypothetical protein